MTADAMNRLFVAVAVDDGARAALTARLAAAGALPGRVVPSANWHLTLRFLGDTPAAAEAALCRALDGAKWPPAFAIRFGAAGAFPSPARARVLVLDVADGGEGLAALAAAVDRAVGAPAAGPFAPHLTLARLKRADAPDVRALLGRIGRLDVSLAVGAVHVMASTLGHGPPRYAIRHTVALPPARTAAPAQAVDGGAGGG